MTTSASMFMKSLKAQLKYINDAKFFEGINIGSDPGNDFVNTWIITCAAEFRDMFNKSLCKDCQKCEQCGDKLKKECDAFMKEIQ